MLFEMNIQMQDYEKLLHKVYITECVIELVAHQCIQRHHTKRLYNTMCYIIGFRSNSDNHTKVFYNTTKPFEMNIHLQDDEKLLHTDYIT